MLKSEIEKLENLSPKDYARRCRKVINAFDIFTKNLSEEQQKIVYNLMYNLLEENYKTDSGYFLKKLLSARNISYYDLARKIYTYLCITDPDLAEQFTLEGIISHLKKMTESKNFTENIISGLVCKYFSVDENLLRYGIGNRYHMDYTKAVLAFKKNHVNISDMECIISEVLDPNNVSYEIKPTTKDYLYYKNFISNSPILFTNLLKLYLPGSIDLIKKEKVCIWDFDYLIIMFYKLSVKEQSALIDLIEQLQNL